MWKFSLSIFFWLIVCINHTTCRTAREVRNIPNYKLAIAEWPSYNIFEPDGPGTYAFGFEIDDPATGNVQFRDEERFRNGTVKGSFGVLMSDGNLTIKRYTSDHRGFRVKTETKRYGTPVSAASVQMPNYYPAQPTTFSSNLLPAEVVNAIYQQQQLQQLRQSQQFQQLNSLQQFQQMSPQQQFQQLNQQQPPFLQPYVPATFNPNPYVSIPDISNSILSYQRPMADEYPAMNSDEQSQVPPKQNQPTNPVVSFISGIPTILNGPNGPGQNLVQNIVRPFTNAFENFQNNLPTLQNNPITNLLQNTQNGIQNLIPSENPLNGVLGNIQNSAAQVLPQGSGNPFQNLLQSGQNLFQNSQNAVQSALQDNPVTNFLNNPSENLQQLLPQGGPLNNFLSNNGFTQNSAFPNIFQNPIFQRPQAATIVTPTQSNLNRYQMLQMNQNRNGTRTTTKRKKTKPSRDPNWLNEFLDDRKRQMADLKGPEVVGETTTMRTTVAEPTTPEA